MPVSFMDQRWEEVRKQSGKTIELLQTSPRMTSLRQGYVLVLLSYSHFTGGLKWIFQTAIPINKDATAICDSSPNQIHKELKNVTVLHRWAGLGYLPVS